MFYYATAFSQPIGNWNISKVTNMREMFDTCGMNDDNYSSTLIGWNKNPLTRNNILLGVNSTKYNQAGAAARKKLIATHKWEFVEDMPK